MFKLKLKKKYQVSRIEVVCKSGIAASKLVDKMEKKGFDHVENRDHPFDPQLGIMVFVKPELAPETQAPLAVPATNCN